MNVIDGAKFNSEIKSGLKGGYLFFGEEDYLKSNALRTAREAVLSKDALTFDFTRLDEDSYSPDALETAILSLPVFSEKRFVELHCFDFLSAKSKDIKDLEAVLSELEDNEDTVFVLYTAPCELNVGEPKKPSKIFKTLCEYLKPVAFEKQSRDKLAKWVIAHFKHNGVEISRQNCERMLDECGLDMFALNFECEKLSAYVRSKGRGELEAGDIDLLATKNPQFGTYDFANAVLNGDTDKALAILSVYKFSDTAGNNVAMTLGSIASVYRDLYNISILKETGADYREIAKKLKMNEYRCSLYYKALKNRTTKDIERLISLCSKVDTSLKTSFSQKDGYDRLILLVVEASLYG